MDGSGHSLLPIPFFFLGAFAGSLLQPRKNQQELARTTLVVAAMLLAGVGVAYLHSPAWASIMILSAAMGMMNTTISHVGSQSVNLGFVTGDLKNISDHLANIVNKTPVSGSQGPWDNHWYRAGLLLSIWTSFLIGAVAGAAFATRMQVWTLLIPAILLIGLAATGRTPLQAT